MAKISELPGIYALVQRMVGNEQKPHQEVSRELKQLHPTIHRGLSARSVARFCNRHNIHATSRMSDQTLDDAVRTSVQMVSCV